MSKVISWIKSSNHWKHMICGTLVFLLMILINLLLQILLIDNLIISNTTTLLCGLSIEYKDKLIGNKFDWWDVLATVILPVITSLVLLFTYL